MSNSLYVWCVLAFHFEQMARLQNKNRRMQWNPIVLRFMLHLWSKLGEKNVRMLEREKVLVFPSKRTLLRYRAKMPKTTGCDPETYIILRQIVDKQMRRREDRDVLLVWDAMGYNIGVSYDKKTGQLLGFADDFQFGLCVQQFANKVNVLTVVSPEKDVKLNFPISHHHVSSLTRFDEF